MTPATRNKIAAALRNIMDVVYCDGKGECDGNKNLCLPCERFEEARIALALLEQESGEDEKP